MAVRTARHGPRYSSHIPVRSYAIATRLIRPPLKRHKLFISHAWDYDDDYYRLENLLKNKPDFFWQNLSVPSHDGIKGARTTKDIGVVLEHFISQADCLIVCSGMYCAHRDWIQFELDMAVKHSVPVIGVFLWGQERTPQEVQRVADEMVGWSSNSITSAVEKWSGVKVRSSRAQRGGQ